MLFPQLHRTLSAVKSIQSSSLQPELLRFHFTSEETDVETDKGSGRGRTRIFSSDHTCRTPLSNSDLCTLLSLPFYLLPREFCNPSLLLLSSPTVCVRIASEKICLHSTLIWAHTLKLSIQAEILRLSLTVALELLYRGNYLFITISLLYKLMIFIVVFTHT